MALSCTVVLARSERYRLSSSTIRSGIDPSSDPAGLMANHARATYSLAPPKHHDPNPELYAHPFGAISLHSFLLPKYG
jgi:hypothetical protein